MRRQIRLTPFSKAFYYDWKLNPFSTDYHIVIAQKITGSIKLDKLRLAFNRFIKQHLLFNSHIIEDNGELLWSANKISGGVDLYKINNEELNEKIKTYTSQPFNLNKGPLYRFSVFEISENEAILVIVLHHIIMSGAIGEFYEFSEYYNDSTFQHKQSIKEQYELNQILSEKLHNLIDLNKVISKKFWTDTLQDIEVVDFSFLKTQRGFTSDLANLSFSGNKSIETASFILNKKLVENISKIGRKFWITEFMYCREVLAILIHKYTGVDKFAIACPISIKEAQNFIYGAQINLFLLRMTLII
jgi:hypothetical protein